MKKDNLYAGHIILAVKDIESYIKGSDFETFSKDTLLQDGVIRKLEIIGEASKRLSLKFKDAFPDIPWKDICGMRDKLVHDYFGVNLQAVWETATTEVSPLGQVLSDAEPARNTSDASSDVVGVEDNHSEAGAKDGDK